MIDVIELKEVSCIFDGEFGTKNQVIAVSPVTYTFETGKRYTIVGESGSGKTTLARMIAGLQVPTTGNIFYNKNPVYSKRKSDRSYFKEVQVVAQNSASALDPKFTIGKAIEEPLLCFHNLGKAERRKRCEELLVLCNLSVDYYSRLPKELSGGEQKRVAIARAIAVNPKCLILDEATNGFDLPLRKKIVEEITVLQKQLGFTMIFVTHDIELAVAISDEIIVMKDSEIIECVPFTGDVSVLHSEYSQILLSASELI